MNPRARLRLALMVGGLLPALLVGAYVLKVALMLQHDAAGRDAFERGDYDGAAAEFRDNRSSNWFERWVAPFDQAAALHAQGLLDEAITAYGDALRVVPDREECTVRTNLALAHEAVGDQQAESGDPTGATESWERGIEVLEAGECPRRSEDAASTQERLEDKIEQSEQQQRQDGQDQPPQQPPEQQPNEQPDGEDPRKERLERNNDRGADRRGEDQDLFGDEDYTNPETW